MGAAASCAGADAAPIPCMHSACRAHTTPRSPAWIPLSSPGGRGWVESEGRRALNPPVHPTSSSHLFIPPLHPPCSSHLLTPPVHPVQARSRSRKGCEVGSKSTLCRKRQDMDLSRTPATPLVRRSSVQQPSRGGGPPRVGAHRTQRLQSGLARAGSTLEMGLATRQAPLTMVSCEGGRKGGRGGPLEGGVAETLRARAQRPMHWLHCDGSSRSQSTKLSPFGGWRHACHGPLHIQATPAVS